MKNKVKYIMLLLVSVVFILSACTPFDFNGLGSGKTATVGGIVKDATTGLPLSGVTVKSGNISEQLIQRVNMFYTRSQLLIPQSVPPIWLLTNTQTLSLVADEQKLLILYFHQNWLKMKN